MPGVEGDLHLVLLSSMTTNTIVAAPEMRMSAR